MAKMAKKVKSLESITREYKFAKETSGTWAYAALNEEGEPVDFKDKDQRISGTNMLYFLKSEYSERPPKKVTLTIDFD